MNRVQLVQVIVIIIALFLGYQMVESFIVFASSAIDYFAVRGKFDTNFIIYYGTASLLYAIGLFVTINIAVKISAWIIEKVQPDENLQLSFSDTSVLYGILLFLTLSTLLKNIPAILYDLFEVFSDTASGSKIRRGYTDDAPGFDWSLLIETIIAFILLVYIKPVANYFKQKIDPHDPYFVSNEAVPVIENE